MSYTDKHGRENLIFSPDRKEKYDLLGREVSAEFLTQRGYLVESLPDSPKDPMPDLRAKKDGNVIDVDAEVKEKKNWRHIKYGLDIPWRKHKFIPFAHIMVCSDRQELVVTKASVLRECLGCTGYKDEVNYKACDNVYTSGFCEAKNGILIVYKRCKMETDWENNHFIRVPYELLDHFIKDNDGMWVKNGN